MIPDRVNQEEYSISIDGSESLIFVLEPERPRYFGTIGEPLVGDFGTLTLNAEGTFTYVANADVEVGSRDVFTYTVTNEGVTSSKKVVFEFQPTVLDAVVHFVCDDTYGENIIPNTGLINFFVDDVESENVTLPNGSSLYRIRIINSKLVFNFDSNISEYFNSEERRNSNRFQLVKENGDNISIQYIGETAAFSVRFDIDKYHGLREFLQSIEENQKVFIYIAEN